MDVVEDVGGVKAEVPLSVGKVVGNGGNHGIGADPGQGVDTTCGEHAIVFVQFAKDCGNRRIHLEQPSKFHH